MPTQPENRGRRVTDKQGISLDAAHMAVRIERVEGDARLLQQQVKNSYDNTTSAVQSLQMDVRGVLKTVGDLSDLRIAQEQDRNTMSRIEKAVADLGTKIDTRFERMERENEDRWIRHEADNENAERDLQQQIDAQGAQINDINQKISRALGWIGGIGAAAALLIGGFLWAVNFRFEDVKDDIRKIDPMKDKIQQLELYLARGGPRPAEPYVPAQPDKEKDQ